MDKEKQRIKIAEACGWKTASDSPNWTYYRPDARGWNGELPDYLNDLNAMHEAEKVLNAPTHIQKHAWNNYKALLAEMCKESSFHATAAQRAEAFCETLNLREE